MTRPDSAGSSHASPRVLVTGASGFTGSHLAHALVREGFRVRALVRRESAATPLLAEQVELAVGDIRDREAVRRAVEGCEQVYHLAALYRDAAAPRHAYWDVNVTGTEHVLEACAAHGVRRLIHCSTMGVHGNVSAIPSDETAAFNPGDDYQRAKLAAEERVWAWHRRTLIPTTVVRPAGIYGPGDLRFLKLFRSIRRGYFAMLGRGTTWFHAVYIDDLVRGVLLCGSRDAAVGEAFCIAGDRYVTLNEFAASIARVLGVPEPSWRVPVWPFYAAGAVCEAVCMPLKIQPPLYRRRVEFFTHNRAFSSAKAERLLGYRPQVSLEDGLRRTAEWYVAHGRLDPVSNGRLAEAAS